MSAIVQHCTAGLCHWAVCSATSAVAIYSLRPDSSSHVSALQPAAMYLPPPGIAVCTMRLLIDGASQLSVLSSRRAATSHQKTCGQAADASSDAQLGITVLDASSALANGQQHSELQPLCRCTQPTGSTAGDAVTRQLLAGGDTHTPRLLVQVGAASTEFSAALRSATWSAPSCQLPRGSSAKQGWRSGAVTVAPIVSVAAGDDTRVQLPCRLGAAVTCLMQHEQQPAQPEDLPVSVLISGMAAMLQIHMRSALQPMCVENGRCLACLHGLLRWYAAELCNRCSRWHDHSLEPLA